jgi:hypothetical protein
MLGDPPGGGLLGEAGAADVVRGRTDTTDEHTGARD